MGSSGCRWTDAAVGTPRTGGVARRGIEPSRADPGRDDRDLLRGRLELTIRRPHLSHDITLQEVELDGVRPGAVLRLPRERVELELQRGPGTLSCTGRVPHVPGLVVRDDRPTFDHADDVVAAAHTVLAEAHGERLLDRQDAGQALTEQERAEAEGLVDLAEFFTLLRMRAERSGG